MARFFSQKDGRYVYDKEQGERVVADVSFWTEGSVYAQWVVDAMNEKLERDGCVAPPTN